MRKLTAAATTVALALTAAALNATVVQAAPSARTTAHNSRPQPDIRVLRFLDKVNPRFNTDIDLGAPGLSAGNQQVFRDDLYQHGRRVGYTAGVGQVVALTTKTLTAQVVATVTLPAGTLTYQFAFTEILAQGPPPVLHAAITGGTGRYRNVTGECRYEFVNNSDDADVTCSLIRD